MGASRSADTSTQNADRLAEDIGSGWSNSEPPSDQYNQGDRTNQYTDNNLDQGWENPDDRYAQPNDRSGYARPAYDPPGYEPSAYPKTEYERKVYGDDLYGAEDTGYEEEPVAEGPEELLDADGVYEADYRVVVPPSRPLDTEEGY